MFREGDILVLDHKKSKGVKARLLVLEPLENYHVKVMVVGYNRGKYLGREMTIDYAVWELDWEIRTLRKKSFLKKEDYHELMRVAVDLDEEEWFDNLFERSLSVPTREKWM